MVCCEFWEVFDEPHMLIREYEHWKLLLRNRNATLGNCIVAAKRHIEAFGDITPAETAELATVVRETEHAIKQAFNYDKINWLMLMMRDRHVHFHVIPRYEKPRSFAGQTWIDDTWPKLPVIMKEDVAPAVLEQMREEIQKHLPK